MGNWCCCCLEKNGSKTYHMGGDVTSTQQRRKVTLPPGYSQLVRCHAFLCSPSLACLLVSLLGAKSSRFTDLAAQARSCCPRDA